MLRELIELNRYLHDFSSAMWIFGTILLWMILKELRQLNAASDAQPILLRLTKNISVITLPALVITLATGGVRAATFTTYEYVGAITTYIIVTLIIKHIAFTIFIVWALRLHWRCKKERASATVAVQSQPSTE